MWPCDGGWACGYNACIPAATCGHARAVLLAKIGQAQDHWASCTCSDDDPGVSLCAVEVDVVGCVGKPKAECIACAQEHGLSSPFGR